MTQIDSKQLKSGDLRAIAGIASTSTGLYRKTGDGTASVVTTGATGLDSLAAADKAAGRTAIGLEALAPATITALGGAVKNVLQLVKPFDFNNQALTNFYLANSMFSGQSGGIGIFIDRLQGAYQKCNITTTNNVDLSGAFDVSYLSTSLIATSGPTATPVVLEVDFAPVYSAAGATYYTYQAGLIILHFHDYYPAALVPPATVRVEIANAFNSTWLDVGTFTPTNSTTAVRDEPLMILVPHTGLGVTKIRFTFTPLATAGFSHAISKIEYFAALPDAWEAPQYLLSAGPDAMRAKVPSLSIEDKAGTAKTTIGQGTLQFNNGATQTASLRGVKTITAPSATDTITVTGAQVGDIVRLSEAVGGKVTAPNTVTFNSTGLNGISVTAIVERFI